MSKPPPPPPPPWSGQAAARREAARLRFDMVFFSALALFLVAVAVLSAMIPPEPDLAVVAHTPEGCKVYRYRSHEPFVVCPAGSVVTP